MTLTATLSLILRVLVNVLGLPVVAGAILAIGGATGTAAHLGVQMETAPTVTVEDLLRLTEKEVVEKVKSKSGSKSRA
ncbi:hypothetical protein [Planobispora longispora]|uniref:Uncharacterized protein n=1 Tax=Planobispora longispora TaxID=28887 RepID=A0A8J3W8D1_9ACTN|nr:hypothetical protein [Planobispora longispora]BFE79003.1 hypothetical protein GCM10020093_016040 [Planobispora longispora]GIH80509.1 hypothetical protein Plo01_69380 [Planobispora longispora]